MAAKQARTERSTKAHSPAAKKWFLQRLAHVGVSGRRAEQIMGMPQGGLTRRLKGECKFTLPEIVAFARLVGVDSNEVMPHALAAYGGGRKSGKKDASP